MTLPRYAYDLQYPLQALPTSSHGGRQRLLIAANRLSIITGGSPSQRRQLLATLAGSQDTLHGLLFGQPVEAGKLQQLACSQCAHGKRCHTSLQQYVMQGRRLQRSWWQRNSPEDQQAVQRLLRDLGIAHLAGAPLAQLDSAQRELADIARTLASSAPVVLLREPATLAHAALPPLLALLGRLALTGRTIVLPLADRQLASRHAQQVLDIDPQPATPGTRLAA